MSAITGFFAVIGFVVVVLAISGAVVPGFNFHLIAADDRSAIEGHERMAQTIKDRLAKDTQ